MHLNLVLHQKQVAANTPSVKRPVFAEAKMESCLRPRYGVFDVFDLSYGGISMIDLRNRVGINWILKALACLCGVRRETCEESTLCMSSRDATRAEASASIRAVELRKEVPKWTLLVTKAGLIVSSRGAANAATTWVETGRRSLENMTIACLS